MDRRKTVIFDFDGTLVDSLLPGIRLCNRVAPEFGFKTVREDEIAKCKNMSAGELFKYLDVPLYKLPQILRRLRLDIAKEIPAIKMVNGVSTCLKQLYEAGIELGVVTSNARNNVLTCLKNNGVLSYFSFFHSSFNLFGKHRTLRRVMRNRKIHKATATYVGDEGRDIEAARRCKINSIAVGWGFQSQEHLLSQNPDYFAVEPMDIAHYILDISFPAPAPSN